MRRTTARLALLALGAIALTGCGGSEPVATPTAPPRATAVAAPSEKACTNLTYADALKPTAPEHGTAPSVPCTAAHTAETFYVSALDDVVDGHLLAVDSTRVQRQSARICPAKLASYLGGSTDDLRLSMLRSVWFTPTVADSEKGASWLRCDVIAVAGAEKLATVKGSLRGTLKGGSGAGKQAMCGTAAPSAAGFERVPCGHRHTWKALQVVDIAGETYPGASQAKAAGQAVCKAAGKKVASDALNYTWSYEWPTAEQWNSGQTYGICWAPSA